MITDYNFKNTGSSKFVWCSIHVGDAPLRVPQRVQPQAGRTGVRPLRDHRKLERPKNTNINLYLYCLDDCMFQMVELIRA